MTTTDVVGLLVGAWILGLAFGVAVRIGRPRS
jgi:hypothetical protein